MHVDIKPTIKKLIFLKKFLVLQILILIAFWLVFFLVYVTDAKTISAVMSAFVWSLKDKMSKPTTAGAWVACCFMGLAAINFLFTAYFLFSVIIHLKSVGKLLIKDKKKTQSLIACFKKNMQILILLFIFFISQINLIITIMMVSIIILFLVEFKKVHIRIH